MHEAQTGDRVSISNDAVALAEGSRGAREKRLEHAQPTLSSYRCSFEQPARPGMSSLRSRCTPAQRTLSVGCTARSYVAYHGW